ncbi:MAG: hypothetical protein A370_03129 [Clostridium sp. Maddingley MBC34-26]|uniref:hypothetical protein n=1 Tax=Clostridium sp. LS TaxID=1352601 RepID=UPI0002974778|nr:hypothetical protein [Clostridium sp. LS]EKQ54539.1 MAG: hypothetical protein A370_03129 [Clostridium sp. Maddingley MBC34-26]
MNEYSTNANIKRCILINLEYKNGLLFVNMNIGYKENILSLKNVVVDTGASYTIINPGSVYEFGIKAEADDKFIKQNKFCQLNR